MGKQIKYFGIVLLMLSGQRVFSQIRVLDKGMHHLRITNEPEWAGFSGKPMKQLRVEFNAKTNDTEQTLCLRQEDVRRNWIVRLNGKELGKLDQDEKAIIGYFPIPAQTLNTGANILTVNQSDSLADDIRVGEIGIQDLPLVNLLTETEISVSVVDRKDNLLVPARITIVNSGGALQPVAAVDDQYLAVRTGCIYTGNGKASFTLPGGKYTIYASRGFEYAADSFLIVLKPGERIERKLMITREVPTNGWVSSDTHIHTYTYSGHGDATLRERAITIAGEGVELPILTDHNIFVDIDSMAMAMKVRADFTPVTGEEFTTSIGHFNVFPMKKGSKVPDYRVKDWNEVIQNLDTSVKGRVIILNHARDLHDDFRPFDPRHHVAVAGMDLGGNGFPANAMEVLNSSSQQKDFMRLFLDWFGMLNRGHYLTPAGGSDSHDVSHYLVGQGRTYIKCADDQPGKIDVDKAMASFLAGKVMVSFGLLAEIMVNGKYGPGDLVTASKEVSVSVRVLGPGWLRADRVSLYANGQKIREVSIKGNSKDGVKWSGSWNIPVSRQDIFLVAIAEGPGHSTPFWPIPKPYQPTSIVWNPKVIGSSGAVWIDGDGNGEKTSAYDYANELITQTAGDFRKLLDGLSDYDETVSVQAAAILQQRGILLSNAELTGKLKHASPSVQNGFKAFRYAWRLTDPNFSILNHKE